MAKYRQGGQEYTAVCVGYYTTHANDPFIIVETDDSLGATLAAHKATGTYVRESHFYTPMADDTLLSWVPLKFVESIGPLSWRAIFLNKLGV